MKTRIEESIDYIVTLAGSIDTSCDKEDQAELARLINELKKSIKRVESEHKGKLERIREAFADYTYTEGCDCCRDIEGHKVNTERLARLLDVEPYEDKSGYDFRKYSKMAQKSY